MSGAIPLECGKYYHIYNRGIAGTNIFFEERNYRHFLRLCALHILPVADLYAYCLLRNHFHVLVRIKELQEVPDGNTRGTADDPTAPKARIAPSQAFSNWFNAYAKAINNAYSRTGALFERPFDRILVTSEEYLCSLVRYIHRNAQSHRFVPDFREWTYSSYHTMLSLRTTHVRRDEVLAWFGGADALAQFHALEGSEGQISHLIIDDYDLD